MSWFVYLVRCRDGSLYCGIATDPRRRVHEHNDSDRGARYTRSRRPVKLVWRRRCASRSAAAREEARIKALPRIAKVAMCRRTNKTRTGRRKIPGQRALDG